MSPSDKAFLARYAGEGGFTAEFVHVRRIGVESTALFQKVLVRPHRPEESAAFAQLQTALEAARSELVSTRNEHSK